MNLRQNGLVMILLAGLLGIATQWANLAWAANLWTLPLALLLLGLAYERIVCARADLRLSIQAPEPWHLAAGAQTRWQFSHALSRTLTVMVAPCLPEGVDATTEVRTMQVPAAPGAVLALPAVSRRLGQVHWPAQPARVAGPLGLAWWSARLEGRGHSTVVPAVLDLNESVSGAALAGARLSHVVGPGAHVEQPARLSTRRSPAGDRLARDRAAPPTGQPRLRRRSAPGCHHGAGRGRSQPLASAGPLDPGSATMRGTARPARRSTWWPRMTALVWWSSGTSRWRSCRPPAGMRASCACAKCCRPSNHRTRIPMPSTPPRRCSGACTSAVWWCCSPISTMQVRKDNS